MCYTLENLDVDFNLFHYNKINSEEEFSDEFFMSLPDNVYLSEEIKFANSCLDNMTLKDIVNWINHQSPEILFIFSDHSTIKTPLNKKQEDISIKELKQVSIRTISSHNEDTYELM